MKIFAIIVGVILLIGIGFGLYILGQQSNEDTDNTEEVATDDTDVETGDEDMKEEPVQVVGQSTEGRDITAYSYGEGDTEILFVGGIHGGYSWNTALVAYELMDYLEENTDVVPEGVKVTVIPVLNPDGLHTVTGTTERFKESDVDSSSEARISSRFNANNVDLNRNFDCDWEEKGIWKSREVSGGNKAFSEPESVALRNYVDAHDISAAVVWYSAAGGVYASDCHKGVLSETIDITALYADASGYTAHETFDYYEITGDAVNWLAKKGIPAISVLLSTHKDVEWSKNQKGIEALLQYYAN